jgi:hypothetical protein
LNLKITDKFITEQVLPKESIACWIKYDKAWTFNRIRISYEDTEDAIQNIQLKNYLNLVNVAIPVNRIGPRVIDIARSNLLMDG